MISDDKKHVHIGFSKNFKVFVVTLVALLFAGYTLWIDTGNVGLQKPHVATGASAEGKLLFQKYNCQACHQIYGLGGYMGQDLTNVYSTPGKGPIYIAAFLQSGTNRMPNFNLNEHDISSLTSYLATVDSTGNSPMYKYKITWYGSIEFSDKAQ